MGKLILMSGVPGSGKSWWCKNKLPELEENVLYVSRDEVRFSMLKDGEDYFSKEKEVFKEFIRQIDEGLAGGRTVCADATHLTKASRYKTWINLKNKPEQTMVILIKVPLDIALARNENRSGRAYVPENVIRDMFDSLTLPGEDEKDYIDGLMIVPNYKESDRK